MKKFSFLVFITISLLIINGCSSSSTEEKSDKSSGEKVEVSNEKKAEGNMDQEKENQQQEKTEKIPFKLDDFKIEVIPTGEIDSAGGVAYSYKVTNNSSIPVKTLYADVKIEFEDGQSEVKSLTIANTLMKGDSLNRPGLKIYPKPVSKIKSYQLLKYKIIDTKGTYYEADPKLKSIEKTWEQSVEVVNNPPFKLNDFTIEVKPTGEVDAFGGVVYSYEMKNNSSMPVKSFLAQVKFEFEDGQNIVDTINIDNTIMNGETFGESGERVHPVPVSKIKSYQLISYKIVDKEGKGYKVDTQLNEVTNY
ncbi:hypothetical protein [Bacillus massiliigorillae]|uniref:hypothetical protein n=1 Tax=Bacillus massiliigorillae TaxID=1243664 RepID=UPI0003A408E1|nr:hypothetical protein [Bacillus massiliigorillae]